MIQADLAKIGVRVNLFETNDWRRHLGSLPTFEPAMALDGWTSDNGDPDNFLYVLLGCASANPGGNNIARWCNPAYDETFVSAAKLTTDRVTPGKTISTSSSYIP